MTTSYHCNADAATEIATTVIPTDSRGLGACRGLLPGDAFYRAAVAIADRPPAQAMLLTGFPVGGIGETDGPPGAMAAGQTLAALGWNVVTVACDTTVPVVDALLTDVGPVIAAPIGESDATAACEALRRDFAPDLVVAIERAGYHGGRASIDHARRGHHGHRRRTGPAHARALICGGG